VRKNSSDIRVITAGQPSGRAQRGSLVSVPGAAGRHQRCPVAAQIVSANGQLK